MKHQCSVKINFVKIFNLPKNLIEEYEKTGILAIGEYHGVKENYQVYENILNELPVVPNLAIEVKDTERKELEKFLNDEEMDETKFHDDGRLNNEFFKFLKEFKMKYPEKKLICFDEMDSDIEFLKSINISRDEQMANNFLNKIEKPILIISGNIHVKKEPIEIENFKIIPMGNYIKNKLGNFPVLSIIPTSGSFYNYKIIEIIPISNVDLNVIIDKGDLNYRIYIEKASPVSLLRDR
jgi:hypothetical protein